MTTDHSNVDEVGISTLEDAAVTEEGIPVVVVNNDDNEAEGSSPKGNNNNDDEDEEGILPSIDIWHEGYDVEDMSMIYNCYCINCEQSTGTTTMLPTKVPYFREIIIMHFICNTCYYTNNEINFGGTIQEYGSTIKFTVTTIQDLNRQLIKSDSATLHIPCIMNFEIPASTQRGTVSTIEGILRTAANNLEILQSQRLQMNDLDNFYRCQYAIKNLRHLASGGLQTHTDNKEGEEDNNNDNDNELINPIFPFDIILNDFAGNSYIENIYAPNNDPYLKITKYNRTPQQDMILGLQPTQQAKNDGMIDDTNPLHKNKNNATQNIIYQNRIFNTDTNTTTTTTTTNNTTHTTTTKEDSTKPLNMHLNDINGGIVSKQPQPQQQVEEDSTTTTITNIGRNEVMKFTTYCSNCYRMSETDMCIVDIPHFKEVIIMSMVCDYCGYKSNEIKGGGGIPKYGCTISLTCTTNDDLAREILKSDTAGIIIPEIELELEEGGLDGLYTTIEGLIIKIRDRLESSHPFGMGDSNRKHHIQNDCNNNNGATIDYYSNERPIYEKYQEFLSKLTFMSQGLLLPFTIIISDPLSNSFIGPIPKDAIALSQQAEIDGDRTCYDNYIDPYMKIIEYTRTHEQNELLGLNDMKTENYNNNNNNNNSNNTSTITTTTLSASTTNVETQQDTNNNTDDDDTMNNNNNNTYYGTDQMEELPDRIRRIDIRGPDHPHMVGKAPVENDTTIMGPGSLNYAVPSIGQRGQK